MPGRYRVIIIPNAFSETEALWDYIAKSSPQGADTVAEYLTSAIATLDFLPTRYEVHQSRSDPALTVYSMAVPPYIVYYRVDERLKAVRAISVRHGARRQPKRFP